MAKKKTIYRYEKRYTIDFFTSSGFHYRTTWDCPYSYVKECRALAKAMGETIKVEHIRTIRHDFSRYE